MLVDFKVSSKTNPKAGDLLIYNENGKFEPISKKELLRDLNDKLKKQENEIEYLKDFLKTYQENMTKLIKEVINNG
jgi:ribosome recycling factor